MRLREREKPEAFRAILHALECLDLEPPVSTAEIKAAYRARSRRLHPDRNPDESAPAEMAALNKAYRTLTDYVERFRFQFTEKEFLLQNPRIRIDRQFTGHEKWKKRG